MLHPTRSNLLLLKDKVVAVTNSVAILKSRRQALIMELLETTRPYLESRRRISSLYGEAIKSLQMSLTREGEDNLLSICEAGRRDFAIEIRHKAIWGLAYREIHAKESATRAADSRGYDYRFTTPTLEEATGRFENITDAILDIAAYDNKLRRLSDEIIKTTRRMRVLEEKHLPIIKARILSISHYLGERDRETHYRLKQFKNLKTGRR